MKKYILITVVAIAIASVVGAKYVEANPSFWSFGSTSTATTSPVYMTPGTGTTTVTIDNMSGGTYASDSAVVLMQITATSTTDSTAPILGVRIDGSYNGVDWYTQSNNITTTGTSTILTGFSGDYRINFASSTANLGASATTSRVHESFKIDTPLRYTRAVFYAPIGGGNMALWANLVAKKQYQ